MAEVEVRNRVRGMGSQHEFNQTEKLWRAEVQAFFRLVLNNQITAHQTPDEINRLAFKGSAILYTGEAWMTGVQDDDPELIPEDFDRDVTVRRLIAAYFLHVALYLLVGELWFAVADHANARKYYYEARHCHRRAIFLLGQMQGRMPIRLAKAAWRRIGRLFGIRKIRGIEAIRAEASRVRMMVNNYLRIIVRPGIEIEMESFNRAARVSNTVVMDRVRQLYSSGTRAAERFGPNELMGHMVMLTNMCSELSFAEGSVKNRKSLASLQIVLALLHWGASLSVDRAQYVFSMKHEEYAGRALTRFYREMGNVAWALIMSPIKWVLGTFERSKDRPDWEGLLPGYWEGWRYARFLRRQLENY
jgi:hypothetical protein